MAVSAQPPSYRVAAKQKWGLVETPPDLIGKHMNLEDSVLEQKIQRRSHQSVSINDLDSKTLWVGLFSPEPLKAGNFDWPLELTLLQCV